MVLRAGREAIGSLRGENVVGTSAEVAFFLLLSLLPLVVSVLSLAAYIGGEPVYAWVVGTVQLALPVDAAASVEVFLGEVVREERPGLFSAGLAFSLWAASIAFFRGAEALRRIHGEVVQQSWIRRRLRAFGVCVLAALTFLVGLVVILAELPLVAGTVLEPFWALVRWPLPLLLLGLVLGITYFFLPARGERASKRASFAGGVAAALLWTAATAGLRFYVRNVGEFGTVYGPVSAIIVIMLWVYASALAVLLGARLVARLEGRWRGEATAG